MCTLGNMWRHVCLFVHWLTLSTLHSLLICNLIYLLHKGVVVRGWDLRKRKRQKKKIFFS